MRGKTEEDFVSRCWLKHGDWPGKQVAKGFLEESSGEESLFHSLLLSSEARGLLWNRDLASTELLEAKWK